MRSAVLTLVLALAATAIAGQGLEEVQIVLERCNMSFPEFDPSVNAFLGEMEYASIPNAEIAYYRFGNASSGRPAVMLVPGLGATMSSWPLNFLKYLAEDHEVIIFDNRGQGYSKDTNADLGISPFTMANDTHHLSETLDLDQPILMGWSMGGMCALTSAALFPDSYSRFVAFSGSAGSLAVPTPDPATILRGIEPDENDRVASINTLFPLDVPSGLEAACWFYAEGVNRLQIPDNATTTRRQLAGLMEFYKGPGVNDLLPSTTKPVLQFSGGLDPIVPPIDQRVAAAQIPDSWLITYPDAAHAAFVQHLDTTMNVLDIFLAQDDLDM